MSEAAIIVGSLIAIAALIAIVVLAVQRRDKRLGMAAAVLAVLIFASPFFF